MVLRRFLLVKRKILTSSDFSEMYYPLQLQRVRPFREKLLICVTLSGRLVSTSLIGFGEQIMIRIGAKALLSGFVNSYNSLLLSTWGEDSNLPQETYAIIDYFRRVGLSLGFYPFCEKKQHDLDWFDLDDDKKLIFHLETENKYKRLQNTVEKLAESEALIRIGLVWTSEPFIVVAVLLRSLAKSFKNDSSETLIVVRSGKEGPDSETTLVAGSAGGCEVRSWIISKGQCNYLDGYDWIIIWPEEKGCFQTARWKSEE